jgi:hypothetical protein
MALVVEEFSAEIEDLEEFAFESGEWTGWTAAEWNRQLLLYCFVRDQSRSPADPLRATLEDLPLLVRDPKSDPLIMAQTLRNAILTEARKKDLDPLSYMALSADRFRPGSRSLPGFFSFLWFTCLIAQGYPDADGNGLFHERFDRLFPRANSNCLPFLPLAWERLSEWLDQGQSFEGFPYQGLELPAVDGSRKHISHSWQLAFPCLLDRRRLARELAGLHGRLEPLQATNPVLVRSLLLANTPFSSSFQEELVELGRCLQEGVSPSAWFVELLDRAIQVVRLNPPVPAQNGVRATSTVSTKAALVAPTAPRANGFGSLLLRSMDYAFGVLLLPSPGCPPPSGLLVCDGDPWLPGQQLLVPEDPADPELAVFDAGSLAIDPQESPCPQLRPLLDRGLLPFATDPAFGLPRLVFDASQSPITHALVRNDQVAAFLERFDAEPRPSDEEHWQCFQVSETSPADLLRFPDLAVQSGDGEKGQRSPLLTTYGGVRRLGEGFLASGLGLPLARLHGSQPALKVLLISAGGDLVDYVPVRPQNPEAMPQEWQPEPQQRQRTDLQPGRARLVAFFSEAATLESALPLTSMPCRPQFRREHVIAWREDWGLTMGPQVLFPDPNVASPPVAAICEARERLNSPDGNVNPRFEEQMLDSLCILFERRSSLSRREFFQLYDDLQGRHQEWPGFNDAVLRGWIEGGWLDEGMERQRKRWRLQPVDPRLVRLSADTAQLVGLQPARGLVELIAHALQHGLEVEAVRPSSPRMPRGWRFRGDLKRLSRQSGLPLVARQDWVADPTELDWVLPEPLDCDGPDWPSGLGDRWHGDRICGNRGRGNHFQPGTFKGGERAPIGLAIDCERSRYGRRRWISRDGVRGTSFRTCHRNRAALHALIVATDGLWPFGITDRDRGQIDRLYDADAYLPLPIGRHAALCGDQMPGPTRRTRDSHTYRYHVDSSFLQAQRLRNFLPLHPSLH